MRSTAQGGVNIVTDGLVYYIDNPNPNCYRPSGTTANNLAGGDISTLENGLGFTNEFNGGWLFDGSNDYIKTEQIDTQQLTLDVWFKFNQPFSATTNNINLFRMGFDPVPFSLYFRIPTFNGFLGYRLLPSFFFRNSTCPTSNFANTVGLYVDNDFLYNMIVTYDWSTTTVTTYLHDALDPFGNRTGPVSDTVNFGSQCSTYEFNNTSQTYNFMDIQRNYTFGGGWPGAIYNFKLYNRLLSEDERNQNYNALKTRFGL